MRPDPNSRNPSSSGDGTRCVHGGRPDAGPGLPTHAGPVLSSTFDLGSRPDLPADFYGRAGNPTWRALEAAIGDLDGGECVLFASGMAAIGAVLRLGALKGELVVPSDGYYLARSLAHAELAPLGVGVREAPTAARRPTRPAPGWCWWRARPTPVSTSSTSPRRRPPRTRPVRCSPSTTPRAPRSGSDRSSWAPISSSPATRRRCPGTATSCSGTSAPRDPALAAQLRESRTRGGAVPGPMEAWLAHRGLGTLDLRLARQATNARAVAELALTHPAASDVRWPGLPGDPAHAVAVRQMRRWNGVLRFSLPSAEAVGRFLDASRLVASATSFGGLRSSADRRARWGDAVAPGTAPVLRGLRGHR